MSHRYKRYTNKQLAAEEELLQKKLHEAEIAGKNRHIAINKRKIEIVQSYMLDQSDFAVGQIRTFKEEPQQLFQIDEMSGVIAWGFRVDSNLESLHTDREAVLIALLNESK